MSHPFFMITGMEVSQVEEAVELLEKANIDLEPELMGAAVARRFIAAYARIGKWARSGRGATRQLDDASRGRDGHGHLRWQSRGGG